jgi:signal transduction histidine kinase
MVGSKSRIIGYKAIEKEYQDNLGWGNYKRMKGFLEQIKSLTYNTEHALTEFIQTQKMNSVSMLAEGLVHDLRNFLVIIQANANKINKYQEDKDQITRGCGAILDTAKKIDTLLTKLSLLQSGQRGNDISNIEFAQELKKCIEEIKSSIPENIQIIQEFPESMMVRMSADELFRIAANLLKNSAEAMPQGGKIKISVHRVKIDSTYCQHHGNAYPGEFAVLRIEDSGNGIPFYLQDRIFDPLFSSKSNNGTRGWGLSIVYSIVKSHNGWLDISSMDGQGTTFELFFPVQTSMAGSKEYRHSSGA